MENENVMMGIDGKIEAYDAAIRELEEKKMVIELITDRIESAKKEKESYEQKIRDGLENKEDRSELKIYKDICFNTKKELSAWQRILGIVALNID